MRSIPITPRVWTFFFALVVAIALSAFKPAAPNFYETAQLGTVLIDVPDGWGTGFVIKRKNALGQTRIFIWTAKHVVENEPRVNVAVLLRDADHKRFSTLSFPVQRVWKTDSDCALLWIDAPAAMFSSLRFDEKLPKLGAPVFVCSNHYGPVYDGAITDGIVSQFGVAQNRKRGIGWPMTDQTTAAINPGCSGGAVFSSGTHGVIGMAVGTSGDGVSVYIPERVIAESARKAGIAWAVDDKRCPPDSQLVLGPVVDALEKLWLLL